MKAEFVLKLNWLKEWTWTWTWTRVVNSHNKHQVKQADHRTTNLLFTFAAWGLVYWCWIDWLFLYNSITFQKSVPGAQGFQTFIIGKSDEKIILFSLASGKTNRRPILLCCRRPLLTLWICHTYWSAVEYKLEYDPCKICSSFLEGFLFSLFWREKLFYLFIIVKSLFLLLPTLRNHKVFFWHKQGSL